MTGLLAAAMASREAERDALRAQNEVWRGVRLCSECFKPLPKGCVRQQKHHQTAECIRRWRWRQRHGWRMPPAHRSIHVEAITAARAEYKAATLAAAVARRKLKALVAKGREIPNEG